MRDHGGECGCKDCREQRLARELADEGFSRVPMPYRREEVENTAATGKRAGKRKPELRKR
jgi:hypothetical protein